MCRIRLIWLASAPTSTRKSELGDTAVFEAPLIDLLLGPGEWLGGVVVGLACVPRPVKATLAGGYGGAYPPSFAFFSLRFFGPAKTGDPPHPPSASERSGTPLIGAGLVRLQQSATAKNSERPMKSDLYQRITDRIVTDLEQGVRNLASALECRTHGRDGSRGTLRWNGKPYSGINVISLWGESVSKGYSAPIWMTFRSRPLELGAVCAQGRARIAYHLSPMPGRSQKYAPPTTECEVANSVQIADKCAECLCPKS